MRRNFSHLSSPVHGGSGARSASKGAPSASLSLGTSPVNGGGKRLLRVTGFPASEGLRSVCRRSRCRSIFDFDIFCAVRTRACAIACIRVRSFGRLVVFVPPVLRRIQRPCGDDQAWWRIRRIPRTVNRESLLLCKAADMVLRQPDIAQEIMMIVLTVVADAECIAVDM